MTEAAGKRVYRNPLADYQDQILFFSFFLLGSIGIWLIKAELGDAFLATAFPLTLMVLYAGVALVTKRHRLREDRVGDNIYYLGFLFTLVSLSHALFNYSSADPANIITNFGIAIFTTIFGLAGRVLFNQMREDPIEYEREARQSLAEATRDLRAQLGDVSMEMSTFKRKIVQITGEGVTDVANQARDAMKENVAAFSTAVAEVQEKFKGAFSDFATRSHELSEAATKNVSALNTLFDQINDIEVKPEALTGKFTPIMDKFGEVADEATKRSRTQSSEFKRVREAMEGSAAAATALREAMSKSNDMLADNFSQFATRLDEHLNDATNVLESLAETTKRLVGQVATNRDPPPIIDEARRATGWGFGLLRRDS